MVILWKSVLLAVQVAFVAAEILASALPPLLDATIDDLRAGLEGGSFNSVALVTVRYHTARGTEIIRLLM